MIAQMIKNLENRLEKIQESINKGLEELKNKHTRWEGVSGWGTHVYPWRIQVNVWQNQYNVVK